MNFIPYGAFEQEKKKEDKKRRRKINSLKETLSSNAVWFMTRRGKLSFQWEICSSYENIYPISLLLNRFITMRKKAGKDKFRFHSKVREWRMPMTRGRER